MAEIARVVQAGWPGRRHGPAMVAGADLLGAVAGVPRRAGRSHPHLPRRPGHLPVGRDRPRAAGQASRTCAAFAVLVAELRTGRESLPSRTWNRLLVWDIMSRQPRLTRTAEKLLNPVMGKSLVVYADKPAAGSGACKCRRVAPRRCRPSPGSSTPSRYGRPPRRLRERRSPAARSRGFRAGIATPGTTSSARWR